MISNYTVHLTGSSIRLINCTLNHVKASLTNDELKKRNVSERKLTLDCIGDTSLIAGAGANVKIKDFGKT